MFLGKGDRGGENAEYHLAQGPGSRRAVLSLWMPPTHLCLVALRLSSRFTPSCGPYLHLFIRNLIVDAGLRPLILAGLCIPRIRKVLGKVCGLCSRPDLSQPFFNVD